MLEINPPLPVNLIQFVYFKSLVSWLAQAHAKRASYSATSPSANLWLSEIWGQAETNVVVNLKPVRSCLLLVFNPSVWWPRAAISNFLDNSRKCNFCTRLILKLLHIFFYKENIKDVFFIFQTKFIFKTLECVWVLEGQQIIFKNRILKKYSFSQ